MIKYYDIHVNEGGGEGYSKPISFGTNREPTDQDVIDMAILLGSLDTNDAPYVDDIREIDENEFKQMKNI